MTTPLLITSTRPGTADYIPGFHESTSVSLNSVNLSWPWLLVSFSVGEDTVFSALFSLSVYPLLSFLLLSVVREDRMFSENEIRNIIFQVLTGLAFVHKTWYESSSLPFSLL